MLTPNAETDRPAPATPAPGGVAPTVVLALTMFIEALGYGMVAPTLPFLAQQAGGGERAIGFLVGLYAAVGLLLSVPLGALANTHGRRSLVLIGLGSMTVASLGFVVAPAYGWLVVARFVQGIGATAIWVGALTIAADLSSDESMGKSLSLIAGAWSLGFVVGPALGGIGTVRTPFMLYAALSAAALVAALVALPETGTIGVRTTFAGIMRVFRRPPVLASAAATFTLSFYYGVLEAFLPLFVNRMNVNRLGIGLLFAIAGLPSIFLPRLVGNLADRVGDVRLIIVGLVYGALFCASFLLLVGHLPLWLMFFLVGTIELLIYIPAVALLNRGLDRDERVFATGSHSYAFSTGFFVGPMIGGLLLPLCGFPGLFIMLTVVMLAGLVTLVALRASAEAAA